MGESKEGYEIINNAVPQGILAYVVDNEIKVFFEEQVPFVVK